VEGCAPSVRKILAYSLSGETESGVAGSATFGGSGSAAVAKKEARGKISSQTIRNPRLRFSARCDVFTVIKAQSWNASALGDPDESD